MAAFGFQCGALPGTPQVIAFEGREGLSELYRFEIHVWVDADPTLDLDAVLGQRGTLSLRQDPNVPIEHNYRGVISEVALAHATSAGFVLTVVLVPEAQALANSQHSRMYTNVSLKEVLPDVFGRGGVPGPQLALSGALPTEEHICQYRETDHAFVSRWMEREGVYYFFDHSGNAEVMVVTDDRATHQASLEGPVRYHPAEGDTSSNEAVHHLVDLSRARPNKVVLQDYDYAKPTLSVSGNTEIGGTGGDVVIHEERFFDAGEGQRLATLRSEALVASARVYRAQGTVVGLRPGYTVDIDDHPRADLNRGFLVVSVVHQGANPSELLALLGLDDLGPGYSSSVELIHDDTPYRHPQLTPWPRIRGYQLGVVEGPGGGDYAQLDDQGRYVVKMMFDESDLSNDAVSTRIRMMQPHSGSPEGWHFPLRKGTEVVIQFLGGDPDRPVVAGAVPNAENPSLVTSSNATQNVLQTGGLTRLEIEDDSGKQFIWLYTPPEDTYMSLGHPEHASHNITLHSNADCLYDIGTNQLINVGGHLHEKVKGDVTETYLANQTSTINGPQTTKVDGTVTETYLSKQTTTVTGAQRGEYFQCGQDTLVVGARSETYQASQIQQVFGGTTETWIGGWKRKAGTTTEFHDGSLTELVAGSTKELCPAGVTETYGPTNGVWASLLWVSPGVRVVAPQCNLVSPTRVKFAVTKKEVQPTFNDSAWWDCGAKGVKLELAGMVTEITNVKLGTHGLAVGLTGAGCEAGMYNIKLTALFVGPVGNLTEL